MIYIVLVNLFTKEYVGIKKKILSQITVFSKEFQNVYYTSYNDGVMHLLLGDKVLEKGVAITYKERNKLILQWIEKYSVNKAYIRYDLSDKWFVDFVRELDARKITSVLEFPTIPYDGELSNQRAITEDKYYREQLAKYVKQCTTYGKFDKVFGIPCIPLLNGIDLQQHPMRTEKKNDEGIVLLAVASMAKWHGYERVIKGMADYYANGGKEKVVFRLVGNGQELESYKQLISKYNLNELIECYGRLEGEELDRQYNSADIAIGTLGMYKINITNASPIKIGEYCARGIPFIYGYEDEGFSGNEKYVLKVSNDSTPLDIREVIRFYNQLKEKDYKDEMRQQALQKYSWETILQPVLDYYRKNKN